ncbi:hypothetical protein QJS10_CPA05g01985 [Acorus calamus]|uniref:Uncharacterized protein n=1 Tax=Acorus calamus TaxID=4465 RepID=A0AAV9ETY5_ACOCL|nr:hypothetical protein QJS10_CPA05g01985 [Acorus calamus]
MRFRAASADVSVCHWTSSSSSSSSAASLSPAGFLGGEARRSSSDPRPEFFFPDEAFEAVVAEDPFFFSSFFTFFSSSSAASPSFSRSFSARLIAFLSFDPFFCSGGFFRINVVSLSLISTSEIYPQAAHFKVIIWNLVMMISVSGFPHP